MDDNQKGKNAKKRPFKLTRQLVRLALNDGWTQKEIADKCRTHQSIVSAWSKGSILGNEVQLKPLLEIYGYKLRRNTFRVYWNIDSDTRQRIFYRVEGKVILSEAFFDPRRDARGKLVKKVPMHKLVIHHQGSDTFRVVLQSRLIFTDSNQELECSIEDGIWASEILDSMKIPELIYFVEQYAEQSLRKFPSDANTLPFLLRQSLLNRKRPVLPPGTIAALALQ